MPSVRHAPTLNAAAPRTGAVACLVNVVADPAAAFRDITTARPWALAVAVVIALRFVSLLVLYEPVLTPLKVLASLAFQVAAVVPPLVVGSTLAWLAARAWRLRAAWPHVFSICAHVTVAHTLVTIAFASVAGALLPDSVSIDVRHPPFTNLGFLIDGSGSSALLHRLAAQADIRSAYAAVLLWLGLRAAGPAEARDNAAGVAGRVVVTLALVRIVEVAALAVLRG